MSEGLNCCDVTLTAEAAMKKTRALEVVFKETEGMQAVKEPGNSPTMIAATNASRSTIMVSSMYRVRS